jgi:uncharacterized membrane protein
MEFLGYLILLAITIFPLWRILQKTGQTPAMALLVLVPSIGTMIVALYFGLGRWPRMGDLPGEPR